MSDVPSIENSIVKCHEIEFFDCRMAYLDKVSKFSLN